MGEDVALDAEDFVAEGVAFVLGRVLSAERQALVLLEFFLADLDPLYL